MRQVRRHLLSGHFVLLASGSPQYIIDEVATHLRVHAAIGTRATIVGGQFTDQLVRPVVFRDGKREAVEKLLERWDLDLAQELALLRLAGRRAALRGGRPPGGGQPQGPLPRRGRAARLAGGPLGRPAPARRVDGEGEDEWGSWDG